MLSLALAALVVSAAPTGLASAPFAQLPTHGAAANIQWRWPDQQLFLTTLQKPLVPARMAIGTLRRADGKGVGARLKKAIARGGDAATLAAKAVKKSKTMDGTLIWDAQSAIMEVGEHTHWLGGAPEQIVTTDAASVLIWDETVMLLDAPPEPLPSGTVHATQIDWTYASTLLVAEDPVYAANRGRRDGDRISEETWAPIHKAMTDDASKAIELIEALEIDEIADGDYRLGQIARFLKQHGRVDAAMRIYRRYRPVGRCSMDRAPAATARAYADLCYGAGRIGCFLQLQVRIMGDRFARTVWSSYGERAASTESKALVEAGVDARRFLRGMLLKYDADLRPREEMNLWRLARSMHESGIDFADDLQALATHPELDPVNRHRAAQALWLLWRRAEKVNGGMVSVRFSKMDLLPVSEKWLAAVEAAHKEHAPDTIRLNAR